MYNLKGVNFDGYPSYDIDHLFDRFEAAQVTEESQLGITVMGLTKDEFDLWKSVFGRNNGYPVTDHVPILVTPETIEDIAGSMQGQPPKPVGLFERLYRAFWNLS